MRELQMFFFLKYLWVVSISPADVHLENQKDFYRQCEQYNQITNFYHLENSHRKMLRYLKSQNISRYFTLSTSFIFL